ncbi:2937_t:CDS:1 [Scutellospora calospora]|uniref:2937_t:CDS:1 n=1 Tax=Scutellospora calospora TaxID=85575 RepID=A0ACA9K785_9GLOM|nr:2937_t:CDS:1 [Scutellospora calospora]
MTQTYYTVHIGKESGIYMNWKECQEQIANNPVAQYKKFFNENNAKLYLQYCKKKDIFKNRFLACPNKIVAEISSYCSDSNAGIGISFKDKTLSEKVLGDKKSAELTSVIRVLESCENRIDILEIKTDSSYFINSYELYLPRWKNNSWNLENKNKELKNKNLFIRIDELFESREGKIILTYTENISEKTRLLAIEGSKKEYIEHMEIDNYKTDDIISDEDLINLFLLL